MLWIQTLLSSSAVIPLFKYQRWPSCKNVYRQALHSADLVKDRKYHFRTYKSCLVGKDMVEWLVKNKHCENRKQALEGLQLLQQNCILHHVCDEHDVKDEPLFYRFRRDDTSYRDDRELALFYKAQQIHNELASRTIGILKNYQQNGESYRNSFPGSDFVNYLLSEGEAYCREEAVLIGRRLLENDTIRHVRDDHHFRDDNRLLYQFTLDFSHHHYLYEVFQFSRKRNIGSSLNQNIKPSSSPNSPVSSPSQKTRVTPRMHTRRKSAPNFLTTLSNTLETSEEIDVTASGYRSEDNTSSICSSGDLDSSLEPNPELVSSTRSVLLRHASVDELESPDTPYVKQLINVTSDAVGFGFVIRGDSPTYVQAVDPMGPAASAGIKVRQYIFSVNGTYALQLDHKAVGQLIIRNSSHCHLVVMTHKREATPSWTH